VPLLERNPELSRLRSYVSAASAGGGRLVLLGGEAGAGKTALIEELRRRCVHDARVLIAGCDLLSQPMALGPVFDIAAELAADRPGGEPAPPFDGSVHQLQRLLADLAGGDRPTLVVIEDVQWADQATLDLLRFLGRRVGSRPLVAVATYRHEELGPMHPVTMLLGDLATAPAVRRMRLEGLSHTAVAVLAEGRHPDAALLHRITGGNPFLVTATLRATEHPAPSIRDASWARMARLDGDGRAIVEAVAVWGSCAAEALMHHLRITDARALERCLYCGLLRCENGALSFRHELVRELLAASFSSGLPASLRDHAAVPRRRTGTCVVGFPAPAGGGGPFNLTKREMQVALLLDDGLRDGEIATRLVLSKRTVNHHVSAIIAKVGVRSRHEASRMLRRWGDPREPENTTAPVRAVSAAAHHSP
jgi:DNA-binding CsgD family transcriptional regulator